jgi:hypothetical protein
MSRFRHIPPKLVSALLLLCVASSPAPTPPKPYLLHLCGIGGYMGIDRSMLAGLKLAGVDADLDHYDWTANDAGLHALVALDRNHQQAKLIAKKIIERAHNYPGIPIYLTSHSGGGGLLVWALEECPEDVQVDTVLFLAPALSPQYDLSKALSHVKNKAYVFFSPHDQIVGPGTKTFGTIDRIRTESAGFMGFTPPKDSDATQYAKLVAMPYLESYMQFNNIGDHIGPMSLPFSQHILAPLLKAVVQPTTRP